MLSVTIKENQLSISNNEKVLISGKTSENDGTFEVFGIFGQISFNEQKYILLITKAEEVGVLDNHPVYEAKEGKAVILDPKEESKDSQMVKRGIERFFKYPGLYFSEYQLYNPNSLGNKRSEPKNMKSPLKKDSTAELNKEALNVFAKALDKKIDKSTSKSSIDTSNGNSFNDQYADLIKSEESEDFNSLHMDNVKRNNEFLFNKKPVNSLLKNFKSLKFDNPGILKCIQGNFSSFKDFYLISRRCPKRLGARFFSRGVGNDGFPSNFVETEQILAGNSTYMQIRGSIPLKWHHNVDMQFHPEIKIVPFKKEMLISHAILERMYKIPIIYLNLIEDKGYESDLFKKFNELYKPNRSLFYNFDFKRDVHKEEFPFDFRRTGFASKTHPQKELIRTNCIDCLDRTNSMQFIIGKVHFEQQLKDAGIQDTKEYQKAFQKAFYENGNKISLQYAGTNAMRSYYITSGGKSSMGLLRDGFYALHRYYINRFEHGKYHTAVNIVVGNLEEGTVDFEKRMFAFKRLPSWEFLLILPVFLFLFKKSSNFYLKVLFSVLLGLYVLILFLRIDIPTFNFDEAIE